MSWSFDIKNAADKSAAKAQVAEYAAPAGGHFPESAQAFVNAIIDALPECDNSVINVRSFGHFQGGPFRGTSSVMVEVSNAFAEHARPASAAA